MKAEMETQIDSETPTSTEPAPESPSSSPLIFTGSIFRVRRGKGTSFQRSKPKRQSGENQELEPAIPAIPGPIPLAYTLAFAHHMEHLISSGEVKDRAELARIFGLSRARVTQILDLTLLAPDIQEEILFMEATGKSPGSFQAINERTIRWVARTREWGEQRKTVTRIHH